MAISVDNSTGIQAPTIDTSAAADASGTNGLQPGDFMKLLIAQLQNQDPDNPVDSKELVTQLSQLSSVQELTQISSKLDALTTATNSSAANQSSGLIGKWVTGTADTATLSTTGTVTSAVTFKQSAASATVNVTNSSGMVVRKIQLPDTTQGAKQFTWDGMTTTGERAPAGTYTFSVDAQDAGGNSIAVDQSVSGIVSGVDYENGSPELQIGTARVPLSNVTQISSASQ